MKEKINTYNQKVVPNSLKFPGVFEGVLGLDYACEEGYEESGAEVARINGFIL